MAREKGIRGGGKTGRQIASGLEGAKRATGTDILRDVAHPSDIRSFQRLAEKLSGTSVKIQNNRPFTISEAWMAAKLEGNSKQKIALASKLLTMVERILNNGGGYIVDRQHYGRVEVVSIPAHLSVISQTRAQIRSLPAIRAEGIAAVNALEKAYRQHHRDGAASYFAQHRSRIRRIIKLSKAEATIAEILRDIETKTGLKLKSK